VSGGGAEGGAERGDGVVWVWRLWAWVVGRVWGGGGVGGWWGGGGGGGGGYRVRGAGGGGIHNPLRYLGWPSLITTIRCGPSISYLPLASSEESLTSKASGVEFVRNFPPSRSTNQNKASPTYSEEKNKQPIVRRQYDQLSSRPEVNEAGHRAA